MLARLIVVVALVGVTLPAALAQGCTRQGNAVTCADGRRGVFTGDAIIWSDGTKSSATPHQSVIIGNRPSVQVGPGVFVGQGRGSVPLDNPNSPYKKQCAVLDAVSYCY
ncbi:MAG: hypothetical protein HY056_03800 [Proteobacteria bacterium]|nr:hypothetical protein [Pseudomonadota bacterium]